METKHADPDLYAYFARLYERMLNSPARRDPFWLSDGGVHARWHAWAERRGFVTRY